MRKESRVNGNESIETAVRYIYSEEGRKKLGENSRMDALRANDNIIK